MIRVVLMVLSVGSLALTLRAAGKPVRLRPTMDGARVVIGLGTIAAVAGFTGVVTPPAFLAVAVVGGLGAGWMIGRGLDAWEEDQRIWLRRTGLAIGLWGASVIAMQGAGYANRAEVVSLGQAVAVFSVCLQMGTFGGRAEPIRIARAMPVAAVVLLVGVVGWAPRSSAQEIDDTEELFALMTWICDQLGYDLGEGFVCSDGTSTGEGASFGVSYIPFDRPPEDGLLGDVVEDVDVPFGRDGVMVENTRLPDDDVRRFSVGFRFQNIGLVANAADPDRALGIAGQVDAAANSFRYDPTSPPPPSTTTPTTSNEGDRGSRSPDAGGGCCDDDIDDQEADAAGGAATGGLLLSGLLTIIELADIRTSNRTRPGRPGGAPGPGPAPGPDGFGRAGAVPDDHGDERGAGESADGSQPPPEQGDEDSLDDWWDELSEEAEQANVGQTTTGLPEREGEEWWDQPDEGPAPAPQTPTGGEEGAGGEAGQDGVPWWERQPDEDGDAPVLDVDAIDPDDGPEEEVLVVGDQGGGDEWWTDSGDDSEDADAASGATGTGTGNAPGGGDERSGGDAGGGGEDESGDGDGDGDGDGEFQMPTDDELERFGQHGDLHMQAEALFQQSIARSSELAVRLGVDATRLDRELEQIGVRILNEKATPEDLQRLVEIRTQLAAAIEALDRGDAQSYERAAALFRGLELGAVVTREGAKIGAGIVGGPGAGAYVTALVDVWGNAASGTMSAEEALGYGVTNGMVEGILGGVAGRLAAGRGLGAEIAGDALSNGFQSAVADYLSQLQANGGDHSAVDMDRVWDAGEMGAAMGGTLRAGWHFRPPGMDNTVVEINGVRFTFGTPDPDGADLAAPRSTPGGSDAGPDFIGPRRQAPAGPADTPGGARQPSPSGDAPTPTGNGTEHTAVNPDLVDPNRTSVNEGAPPRPSGMDTHPQQAFDRDEVLDRITPRRPPAPPPGPADGRPLDEMAGGPRPPAPSGDDDLGGLTRPRTPGGNEPIPAAGEPIRGPVGRTAEGRWMGLNADGAGNVYDGNGNYIYTVDEHGTARLRDGTPVEPAAGAGSTIGYYDSEGRLIGFDADGRAVEIRDGVGTRDPAARAVGLDPNFTDGPTRVPAQGASDALPTARNGLDSVTRGRWDYVGAGPNGELFGEYGQVIGRIDTQGRMWTSDGREIVSVQATMRRVTRVRLADGTTLE